VNLLNAATGPQRYHRLSRGRAEQSFNRAATQLGVSRSALSQAFRGLEARLGVPLLTRTTRPVAPTEAGERLFLSVGPGADEIQAELASLSEPRESSVGTVRVAVDE
jgi:DNA-binding transcriptional LysR family regulator